MKKIVYLLVWAGIIGATACSDVNVGYLAVEKAAYAQDTLSLYNMQERLEELTKLYDRFEAQAGPLIQERAEWDVKRQEKQYELWDFDDYEITPLEELIDATTDPVQLEALKKQLEELYVQRARIKKELDDINDKRWTLRKQIEQISIDLGIGSERELSNKISKLKNTMEYGIPWVTSPIESVFGTEPLIYSIAEVKNENPVNAELFRKSLTIIGGGRMYVEQNVEAPPGRYIISVRIENEGQSTVLRNAFTFIIEK
ncbi:hypothetical protein [Gabonibacter chumensis]|uniref:hypothetical protein n=1 Tax=Gabonibacter chumensis TaxID=2972474 RepID=UPI0025743CC2|nr:hypothetical protein [Gabonibacter chumensis]MCR9011407.1 hypothetical protein [Gabonibacter chumensis]